MGWDLYFLNMAHLKTLPSFSPPTYRVKDREIVHDEKPKQLFYEAFSSSHSLYCSNEKECEVPWTVSSNFWLKLISLSLVCCRCLLLKLLRIQGKIFKIVFSYKFVNKTQRVPDSYDIWRRNYLLSIKYFLLRQTLTFISVYSKSQQCVLHLPVITVVCCRVIIFVS